MSYSNPRIKLRDSLMDVVQKMSGGNPGATIVLMKILKESPKIDPQSALGGWGTILSLDTENIYEERIWMLYKNVCGKNIVKTLACLRSSQLGFITTSELNAAIDGKSKLDVDDLLNKVKNRLNKFDKNKDLVG